MRRNYSTVHVFFRTYICRIIFNLKNQKTIEKKKKTGFLLSALALGLLFSCSTDNESTNEPVKVNSLSKNGVSGISGFIDADWSKDAFISDHLLNMNEDAFIKNQNAKISSLWGMPAVPLQFAIDLVNPASTRNAYAITKTRSMLFGEQLYKESLALGRAVPVGVLAHEIGHIIQVDLKLAVFTDQVHPENSELEADGYAGYFIGHAEGYNASWQEAGLVFEQAFNHGDYKFNTPGFHGTPEQRRSATRLGYLLSKNPGKLSAADFNYYFFYYFNDVLNGVAKKAGSKDIKPEIDAYMKSKMSELRKIKSGEISKEEFLKLKD